MHEPHAFLDVAGQRSPTLDVLLLALAAQFLPVDQRHTLERLDDLSRLLFGLPSLHAEAQAGCVLHALRNEIGFTSADCDDPAHLMLDRVLDSRRGHPLLLTSIAVELARRAGVRASVCSSAARWYAAFGDEDIVLVEVSASQAGEKTPGIVQRHCAHEVGQRALSRLCLAFGRRGRCREARRAADLLRGVAPCRDVD